MNNNKLRIAIDGGAGTGKSTISKLVAEKLGITYINTGQIFRFFALIAFRNKITNNEKKIYEIIKNINFSFDSKGKIISKDIDFSSDELEKNEISLLASKIASMKSIRELSTNKQIELGKKDKILLEGRDIASTILPNADYKFFITIKPEIAAKRRFEQYKNSEEKLSYKKILKDIVKRNEKDSNRKISPLKLMPDATVIDSSDKTAEEIANIIIEVING